MNNCSFSLDHYKKCLELAKNKGYSFFTMNEYLEKKKNISKAIVMRHDIDHNVELALNFAKIEYSLGIKTTYFFRLHAKYNLQFSKDYKILKEIQNMGHEIGLHHDCDFANLNNEDPINFLKRDLTIFENIINKKVHGITSHEPNKSNFIITDENIHLFNLKYQGYSDIFFKQMKYISDSSSRWREGCMCNFIEKEVPLLCILTHPFWWYNLSPLQNY